MADEDLWAAVRKPVGGTLGSRIALDGLLGVGLGISSHLSHTALLPRNHENVPYASLFSVKATISRALVRTKGIKDWLNMPSQPVGSFAFPPIPLPQPAHYPSQNIHIEGNDKGDHVFAVNDKFVALAYDLDHALAASTILVWEGIPPTAKECTLSFNAATTFGEHDTASSDISGVYITVIDDPSSLQVGITTWNNAPPSPFFLGTALFQNGVNRQLGELGLVDGRILKRLFLGEKATIECAKWVRGGRLAVRFDEVAILTGLTAPEGRWGVVGWDQSLSAGGRSGQGWFVTYVS